MSDSVAPPGKRRAPAGRRAGGAILFLAGIVALAFNMRTAITSLPPVFPALSARLGLSPAEIGLLASTPILCFAVFSPAAAPLSRRYGEERVLLTALGLLAGGLLLRGAAPSWLLFPGTVVAAAAIASINVLLPSLVKRRRPERAGMLLGSYLLSLSAGSVVASFVAVPVLEATGSVPVVLAMGALPALAAMLVWAPQWRSRTAAHEPEAPRTPGPQESGAPAAVEGQAPAAGGGRGPAAGEGKGPASLVRVWRHRLAWQVLGFMGLQSLTYFTILSWLPTLLQDRGLSAVHAGDLLGVMSIANAVCALVVPVLAHRVRDQRALVTVGVASLAAGAAGSWFAPLPTAPAWAVLLGLGQGSCLALAIYFAMARAPDPVTAASLSSFAQSGGYLLATTGPLIIGFLHTATGDWTIPVAVLLAFYAAQFSAGWHAARDRILLRRGV